MNLVIETVYLIARIIGFIIFFVLFSNLDREIIFKVFIATASIWAFVYVIILRRLVGLKQVSS